MILSTCLFIEQVIIGTPFDKNSPSLVGKTLQVKSFTGKNIPKEYSLIFLQSNLA